MTTSRQVLVAVAFLAILSVAFSAIPAIPLVLNDELLKTKDAYVSKGYKEIGSPFADNTVLYDIANKHTVIFQGKREDHTPRDILHLLDIIKSSPSNAKRLTKQQQQEVQNNIINAFKTQPVKAPTTKQDGSIVFPIPDHYFKFIPYYLASLMLSSTQPASWSAPCFQESSASASTDSNGKITITFNVAKPASLFCTDTYLVATADGLHFQQIFMHGTHTMTWHGLSAEESADIQAYGLRLFYMSEDYLHLIADVYHTAMLFLGPLTHPYVSDDAAQRNLQFLHDYANITMPPRAITDMNLDESQIQSGWFLGIIRLDGLDPMLAWAMGSHTGHTAITLRINGTLYVCESTTNSAYWPVNGIQKTPWAQWIQQAKRADYNVVLLPLNADAQAKFDEQKATEWFLNHAEGLHYGFHNMLFSWIDTPNDNFPPPLDVHSGSILFALVDKIVPKIADLMVNEALNKRLNTTGLSTQEMFIEAFKRGIALGDLYSLPEQDAWIYSDGPNMVCDVLVLSMYKAAGVLGDLAPLIQATEFTNNDVYTLNLFDSNWARPSQCVQADPDLPFCQILGKYRMHLPGYNTVQPFPYMRERCPGIPPLYERPANC